MSELSKYQSYLKLKKRIAGYAGAFTVKLRNSLVSRNNITTTELYRSIKSRVVDGFDEKGERRVGFQVMMKGYGAFLNKNIHPKTAPPVDVILKWMDEKGIKMDRSKSKYKLRTRKQVAYLIARSIQKKGFSTFNRRKIGWLDIVWVEEQKRLRGRIRKDLRDAVRGLTQELLTFERKGQQFQF